MTKRYVREAEDGWEIVAEKRRRATIHASSKDEAVAKAKRIVRDIGGGEVKVLNTDGKIIATARVRPSRWPAFLRRPPARVA